MTLKLLYHLNYLPEEFAHHRSVLYPCIEHLCNTIGKGKRHTHTEREHGVMPPEVNEHSENCLKESNTLQVCFCL